MERDEWRCETEHTRMDCSTLSWPEGSIDFVTSCEAQEGILTSHSCNWTDSVIPLINPPSILRAANRRRRAREVRKTAHYYCRRKCLWKQIQFEIRLRGFPATGEESIKSFVIILGSGEFCRRGNFAQITRVSFRDTSLPPSRPFLFFLEPPWGVPLLDLLLPFSALSLLFHLINMAPNRWLPRFDREPSSTVNTTLTPRPIQASSRFSLFYRRAVCIFNINYY